ncbi:MAG: GatB/YqeY domain-containing protein [Bacteroidales bacterium]|nr:GatB/YqeY domain-containing protein [Bacteroidales bacterium]MCF8392214.1 GatB/YqeY domain-containing protein [Bacteroidales bacterium]
MKYSAKISEDIKQAMRDKEKIKLEALRAVKTAFTIARTSKSAEIELSDEEELKIMQKLVKQRKESAAIYSEQNRPELATKEEEEATFIEQYLPAQMTEAEIKEILKEIVAASGASGMADMGMVMGLATKKLAGKADGKIISQIVREILQ